MPDGKPWDIAERTFIFATLVARFCSRIQNSSLASRHFALQLRRSGTVIGANVEEARDAYSRREFACKNAIALREARETRYWLRLLNATELAGENDAALLLREVNELVAILTAIVCRAKQNEGRTTRRI